MAVEIVSNADHAEYAISLPANGSKLRDTLQKAQQRSPQTKFEGAFVVSHISARSWL
ncbi:MAG TPA: hypothetical protein VIJ35_12455 [Bradyrhizobium sp.]